MGVLVSKIAVIGDRTSVLGYRGLGLDTFEVAGAPGAREVWPDVIAGGYDVIFVTEDVYGGITDLVDEVSEQATPAVSVIPPATGGTGLGGEKIRRIVEKAIGTDVLIREEEE